MWVLKNSILKFVEVVNFLIIARVLSSWFVRDYSNPILRMLYQITEPILSPFRNLLNRIGVGGTIDFSPILTILALDFIASLLINIL